MSLLLRKRVILAKLETTYGVDAAPTTTDAMLVRNLVVNPLEGSSVPRDFVRPYLGASGNIRVENYATVELEVEMAGSGAAGTAPKWGVLMKASGFQETITPATDTQYDPISTFGASTSCSIYFNLDGVRHVLLGARGSVSMDIEAKQIPVLKFKFTGLLGTISDVTLPAGDFSAFQTPVTVSTQNTTGLNLQGFTSANLKKLTIDMANNVVYRLLVGAESVLITDRKPIGSVSIEATTVTAKDWWTQIKTAATGAFAIQHGQIAGNIVAISAPKMQLDAPKYSDDNGVAMLDMNMTFIPNTGNDELKITVK